MSDKDKSRQRFYREAQAMAGLNHAAIVPIHDFGEQDGRPFIVMRLMEGGSLSEWLEQKGPFSLAEAILLFERLAPGVDLAHETGLVHRDLKPDNILLDRDQNPYIADFGIVKLLTPLIRPATSLAPLSGQRLKRVSGNSEKPRAERLQKFSWLY